jgi:hypothetical protein
VDFVITSEKRVMLAEAPGTDKEAATRTSKDRWYRVWVTSRHDWIRDDRWVCMSCRDGGSIDCAGSRAVAGKVCGGIELVGLLWDLETLAERSGGVEMTEHAVLDEVLGG